MRIATTAEDIMKDWRNGLSSDGETLTKLLVYIYKDQVPEPIAEIINHMFRRELEE